MRNQGQLALALVVIAVGVALFIVSVLDVNVWTLCFPVALILLGLWVLIGPGLIGTDRYGRQKLLGDIIRRGVWSVTDEEFWIGVGDVRLDMSEAEIPTGETLIKVWSFISDVRLSVPEGVGVAVSSTAFIVEVRLLGRKRERFLSPINIESDDYTQAERTIRLETTSFIGDVRIRRVGQLPETV
jgi:predicted membrane protein